MRVSTSTGKGGGRCWLHPPPVRLSVLSMGRRVSLVIAVVAMLLMVTPNPVAAQAQYPAMYWGSATVYRPGGDEVGAPVGTEITARVGELQAGRLFVTEAGMYGGPGGGDPKLLVQGDIEDGNLIRFFANGFEADETSVFESGLINRRDLRIPDTLAPSIDDWAPTGAVDDTRPDISASFSDALAGIDVSSVVLMVDDADVTAQSTVAANGVSYTPASLLAESAHTVELRVSDAVGNEAARQWSFTVGFPPIISNIGVSAITSSGAVISWVTDEPATSRVDYGETAGYGSSAGDDSLVTSHGVVLSGLEPDTTYHFRVRSADAGENEAVSGDNVFTTASEVLVQQTIGPGGGTVGDLETHGISIEFPEGAVTADVTVIIRKPPLDSAPPAPSGFKAGASIFLIQAFAADGTPVNILEKEITITFRYTDEDLAVAGGDPGLLTLAYYDEDAGEWRHVPTTVDTEARTLACTVDHLSLWMVLVKIPSPFPWWAVGVGVGVPLAAGVPFYLLVLRKRRAVGVGGIAS